MFNKILKGLQVLITGKQMVDSFKHNRPLPQVKPVLNPIEGLQHPAAVGEQVRKKRDCTKLTDEQIKHILSEYEKMHRENGKLPWDQHKTTFQLTKELNDTFGLNKSRTAYSAIWNQKTVQETELND
jgi:hypothetical protein